MTIQYRDHPANLIKEWLTELPQGSIEKPGGIRAREILTSHESENKVSFITVDNDTLAAVLDAWERVSTLPDGYARTSAADDFFNSTRDLLGLEG